MANRPDPVRLEIFHQLLAALCEEGGSLLQRSAVSPNIRERRDFSFALFDREAQLVAQAAHIPVHLGSAGDSVRAVREALDLVPGDVAILNDPYAGGTHLPDVTMVRPVFLDPGRKARPAFFLVNRAHHADFGGSTPGSMGVAQDLVAEGLVLPPVHYARAGTPNEDLLRVIRANVRGAGERMLDLEAQHASLAQGEVRLRRLVEEHGRRDVERYAGHLMDYVERHVGSVLAALPHGDYQAEDFMESDGTGGGPFRLCLRLEISRPRLHFDFRGTDPQAAGGINANRSIVMAACVYLLRCLCPTDLPTNEGLFRRVAITTEPSLLQPERPAPVAGGNVETSQRLVDLGMAALAKALPDTPAQSAGTMTNVSAGGAVDGVPFAFYETLPGGAGAAMDVGGESVVQTHMTNTRNTPVEEAERQYPLVLRALSVRRGSGGRGAARGGDGLRKVIEFRADTTVSLFAERHQRAPQGTAGGEPGKPGRFRLVHGKASRRLPAKCTLTLLAGDSLEIETPGGGGHGGKP